MKSEADWATDVKHPLRREMAGRGVTCDQVTEMPAEIGVIDTSVSIRDKVSRGKFAAVLFLRCLKALGCEHKAIEIITHSASRYQ